MAEVSSPEYLHAFALRLNAAMAAKGLRQVGLAEALGVTQQVVSSYCRGTTLPVIERFPRLAQTLGVSLAYLLGFSEEEYQGQMGQSMEDWIARSGEYAALRALDRFLEILRDAFEADIAEVRERRKALWADLRFEPGWVRLALLPVVARREMRDLAALVVGLLADITEAGPAAAPVPALLLVVGLYANDEYATVHPATIERVQGVLSALQAPMALNTCARSGCVVRTVRAYLETIRPVKK